MRSAFSPRIRMPARAALLAVAACAGASVGCGLRIGLLSDLHIGEGCVSPYNGEDDCYSVQNLQAAVSFLNQVVIPGDGLDFIFITGDVTSSAELAQYKKVRILLDNLTIPYLPIIGNHDVWPYASTYEFPAPTGDVYFAQTFQDVLTKSPLVSAYNNASTWNPQNNCTSWFQNFEVDMSATDGVVFLACDYNTRDHALPGYKGALPQADLHNFTGGTFPWVANRLTAPRAGAAPPRYFFLHHQPYRCPFPIPDWSFCFSSEDKSAIQSMLMEHHPVSAYWGSLNGHIHMWDNGTAFDNWPTFRQWETSACKGNALNANLTSAITSVFIEEQTVAHINYYWRDNGVWQAASGS